MKQEKISGGTVHKLPSDLQKALTTSGTALKAWKNISSLARNEWICWIVSVKKAKTRKQHIQMVVPELKDGMRRPCCWIGCVHRKDKPMSATQKFMLTKKSKKKS
ncbi:MAG: YdeI/OmpD-associated family protein [bacterium]|nr:YdeI/OmpD-associated family protein [bacterium]